MLMQMAMADSNPRPPGLSVKLERYIPVFLYYYNASNSFKAIDCPPYLGSQLISDHSLFFSKLSHSEERKK